jgi:segregation and condensation protein B
MTTLDMEEFRQAHRRAETPENRMLREASRVIEALLFASSQPLSEQVLQTRLPVAMPIARVLDVLQADYHSRGWLDVPHGRGFGLSPVARSPRNP